MKKLIYKLFIIHILYFTMKITRKSKNDNLYIKINSIFDKNPSIKIIINKKKMLEKHDEEDDYWDFLCNKIIDIEKYNSDKYNKIIEYLGKPKFNECKKIKIYYNESKKIMKNNLDKRDKCYIYYQDELDARYRPINLIKLCENKKLYKKFLNRYCYFQNFGLSDSETCGDYYNASKWFIWFMDKYYENYQLPLDNPNVNDLKIYINEEEYRFSDWSIEPKMDYDNIFVEYFEKININFY